LRLQLECQGELPLAGLSLESLRLYLHGEDEPIAKLYELLFNHTTQVLFRPLDRGTQVAPVVATPSECLGQVGFEQDEALLPYPTRSFPGYRLLTEFFTFPNKFLFVDVNGWRRVSEAGFGRRVEVVFFLDRTEASLEQAVETQTFRLGCAPVVNLFAKSVEGIDFSHLKTEYLVLPDVAHRLGMEVYSVDSVTSIDSTTGQSVSYQPFYSFRHGTNREDYQTFWYASRQPSILKTDKENKDRGTDVFLSLVDLGFNPRRPPSSTIVVRTTCTNRDLPIELQKLGDGLYLELEAAAPLKRINCLRPPTAPLRPPLRRGAHWRLISHLALNHLSLSDPVEGRQALQEILRLYDFSDPDAGQQLAEVTRQVIEGIASVSSRRVVGRVGPAEVASGFCRGVEVTIEFDERQYVGTGAFLFASVLERFLGLYASINSFTQLVATVQQREGMLKKWPPRAGDRPLV
jgi:type VI secretion system protein ImpG